VLWVRSVVFALVLPGSVLVWVPLWVSAGRHGGDLAVGGARWLGLPLVVVGAAGLLWCIWDFGRRGRGTLAPVDPPRFVVRTGLYRVTRNPMYLAVLVTLVGETLLFASPRLAVWTVVVAITVHLFVVLYEEPTLQDQFGPPYEAYRASVARWLPHPHRLRR
jgi:protein-S-isoprenylcysteine O-methyltransferase Ste14